MRAGRITKDVELMMTCGYFSPKNWIINDDLDKAYEEFIFIVFNDLEK